MGKLPLRPQLLPLFRHALPFPLFFSSRRAPKPTNPPPSARCSTTTLQGTKTPRHACEDASMRSHITIPNPTVCWMPSLRMGWHSVKPELSSRSVAVLAPACGGGRNQPVPPRAERALALPPRPLSQREKRPRRLLLEERGFQPAAGERRTTPARPLLEEARGSARKLGAADGKRLTSGRGTGGAARMSSH